MSGHLVSELNIHFPAFIAAPKDVRNKCVEDVLLFMFRGLSSVKLSASLKEVGGRAKAFRLGMRDDGYLFAMKACIYYLHVHKVGSRTNKWKRVIKHFRIREEDIPTIKFALKSPKVVKLLNRHRKSFEAMRLTDYKAMLDAVAEQVQIYAIKYARKKMSFISRSNSMDIHDLSRDLVLQGLAAINTMYPCIKSPLHALNIIKQAIHNSGVNSIHYHTTQSRGLLVKNSDGTFSSRKVSFDLIGYEKRPAAVHWNAQHDDGDPHQIGIADTATMGETAHDELDAKHLLSKYTGKKLRLLQLMCGEPNRGFTHFLRDSKVIGRTQDNEDYFVDKHKEEGGMDEYVLNAIHYLDCNEQKALRFVRRLRKQLGG